MGEIRKQAILSSIVIYAGFGIGFVNTWLFIRSGIGDFTPAQYGLTRLFFDVGTLMFAVASLGVISVIFKFFPYYQERVPYKQNDLYGRAFLFAGIGFSLVLLGGWLFEPLIIRKFSERSLLFVDYYYWIFFFGIGILLFNILDAVSVSNRQAILPNFLRETGLRFITCLLLVLYVFKIIDFKLFIQLFSFQFLIIAVFLLIILRSRKQLPLTLHKSIVTKKFSRKMTTLAGYIYGGSIITILSQVIDSILIASISEKGIHDAGVYNLATYIANLIQVPQRSMISATIPVLVLAWKNKHMHEIDRLYKRSSINLLLVGLFLFFSIWMNFSDLFELLGIQNDYKAGMSVVLIIGITKLIDAGTGINAQIISTSSQWRFEFITGILLVLLMLPLNYILIKEYGITGSAYANLLSFTIYNLVRYGFLWYRYRLQPFTPKTFYSILIAAGIYFIVTFFFNEVSGWGGLILRNLCFSVFFIGAVFVFNLTPDAGQLWNHLKFRFRKA